MKSYFNTSESNSNLESSFLKNESSQMRGDGLTKSFLEGREPDKQDGLENAFLRDADNQRSLIDIENFERIWEERRPEIPKDRIVHGGDLKQAFESLLHSPEDLANYAYTTNATMAKHIDRIAPQMINARANGDSARVNQLSSDLFRGASGLLGEIITGKVASLYFDKVKMGHRSENGETVTDFLCEGARCSISLGGKAFIPKGGSLAIEVKTAKPNYFRSQLEGGHLSHQVQGHHVADGGVVISTKNMKITSSDMIEAYSAAPKELRDKARETLRENGSPLFCFLPPKEEIDRTMMGLLERRMKQLENS